MSWFFSKTPETKKNTDKFKDAETNEDVKENLYPKDRQSVAANYYLRRTMDKSYPQYGDQFVYLNEPLLERGVKLKYARLYGISEQEAETILLKIKNTDLIIFEELLKKVNTDYDKAIKVVSTLQAVHALSEDDAWTVYRSAVNSGDEEAVKDLVKKAEDYFRMSHRGGKSRRSWHGRGRRHRQRGGGLPGTRRRQKRTRHRRK